MPAAPAEVPAHVPDHLVLAFDIYGDPRLTPDPQAGYAALRTEAPDIFYTPLNGGHWVVTRSEPIGRILKSPQIFSSSNLDIPATDRPSVLLPLTLDPPSHTPYRQMLMQFFSAKAMHALEPHIRDWSNRLIDEVIAAGECDFVRSISGVLPVSVFMQLMGLPLDRLAEFRGWTDEAFKTTDSDERAAIYGRIIGIITGLIIERSETRQDDLISRMLDCEVDGRAISIEEVQGLSLLLFIAGMDTVANAMTFGMRHLAQHPDLQAAIKADPAGIPDIVEEVLRRYAFTSTVRKVVADTEIDGVGLHAGDMVFCSFVTAGLDDRIHADPLAFDPGRTRIEHLTFGGGPHKCAGRHLARIEMRILFEEIARRMSAIRLKPGAQPTVRAGHVLAADRLDILFEAA